MNDVIKKISLDVIKPLTHISTTGAKRIETFLIDCDLLEDFNNVDIRNSDNFKELFDKLQVMTGPCLYYFEVLSDHLPSTIINNLKIYSSVKPSRATPAIKSNIPNSKILYVGKVKRHMYGRLIQHLGFFPTPATQGLQLFYWTRNLPLSLKLTVMEFEPEMINLMQILESELARKISPILGKHK